MLSPTAARRWMSFDTATTLQWVVCCREILLRQMLLGAAVDSEPVLLDVSEIQHVLAITERLSAAMCYNGFSRLHFPLSSLNDSAVGRKSM